jgi:hypothetical protein
MKDIKKFWLEHKKSRIALDDKMRKLPYAKKLAIAERLRSDAALLKRGKIVSSS